MTHITDLQRLVLDLLLTHRVLTIEHFRLLHRERNAPGAIRNLFHRMKVRGFLASYRVGPQTYFVLTTRGATVLGQPRIAVGGIASRWSLMARIGALDLFANEPRFSKLTRGQFLERFAPQAAELHRRHPMDSFFIDGREPERKRLGTVYVHQTGNPRLVGKRLAGSLPETPAFTNLYASGRFSIALIAATPARLRELRAQLDRELAPRFQPAWPPLVVHTHVVSVLLDLADRRLPLESKS